MLSHLKKSSCQRIRVNRIVLSFAAIVKILTTPDSQTLDPKLPFGIARIRIFPAKCTDLEMTVCLELGR
jgi:hypothetical protein